MSAAATRLLLGTSKGLVVLQQSTPDWAVETVHFLGFPVSVAWADPRNGVWWVALAHRHWGQKLHRSRDEGRTWEEVAVPRFPPDAALKGGKPATLRKIWAISDAGADKPQELLMGTEPGGLFHSRDNGDTWQLVDALWNHPSRLREDQWFGAGRDHPYIHSIVVDPRDNDHYYIAVSCAGVFETTDAGRTWAARNEGLIATYLPNPEAEIGHDPHMVLACRTHPDVLWQQNHCGIFRTEDGGRRWENVSGPEGFPEYGFALAIDHEHPERAWVAPAISDEMRVAAGLALCICRTDDGGRTWTPLRRGLPQDHCFDIVFRHSMDSAGRRLAFGTTNGAVYLSDDYGDSWRCLCRHLARIDYLRFA